MASINKVFLIGNLGADPELRQAGSSPVCNFRIATTEVWNSKQSGERQERTEWHRIVVWGKSAEHCGEYLKKGCLATLKEDCKPATGKTRKGTSATPLR